MNSLAILDQKMVTEYAAGPDCLEAAIARLSEANLDVSLGEGNWTIRQVVHHLADGDDIWKVFIKRAIGDPGGEFSLAWYWQMPQNEWAKHWAYNARDIAPSLVLFRASRGHIMQLLESHPAAWENSLRICWPDGSEQDVSVRWVVEMQIRHLAGHLEDIRRIRSVGGI